MTHIDPDVPRAGSAKPTDLEERAWLLARTTTRLELARRVVALAEDIERLHERLAVNAPVASLLQIAERLSPGERVVIDMDHTGKATITATTTDTSI